MKVKIAQICTSLLHAPTAPEMVQTGHSDESSFTSDPREIQNKRAREPLCALHWANRSNALILKQKRADSYHNMIQLHQIYPQRQTRKMPSHLTVLIKD